MAPTLRRSTARVPNNADDEDTWINGAAAVCPDGKKIVSGGYVHSTGSLGEMFINAPEIDGLSWVVAGVNWANPEGTATAGEITAIAYCVPTDEAQPPYAERKAAAIAALNKAIAKAKATKRR